VAHEIQKVFIWLWRWCGGQCETKQTNGEHMVTLVEICTSVAFYLMEYLKLVHQKNK
jgi:hypothetical protein